MEKILGSLVKSALYAPAARRALGLLASVLAGLALAAGLLAALQPPAPARAGPLGAPAAVSYPGPAPCATTLQACIEGVPLHSTILISAGDYFTSVTLDRAVSLVGAGMFTTTLHALPSQRVMSVTAPVTAGTAISDLGLEGGNAGAASGGGLYLAPGAQPTLARLFINQNSAANGGGLYANSSISLSAVTLGGNTATHGFGGGLDGLGDVSAVDCLFLYNTVITSGSGGGANAQGNFTGLNLQFGHNAVTDGYNAGGLNVVGEIGRASCRERV